MEFDEESDDYKADSLSCGHQFSAFCWKMYLKDKINSVGPNCVFTKCAQLRCNMVIPHSFFLKYIGKDELDDDGVNYYRKYMNWHYKQFTDLNKSMKWCPRKNCEYIVQVSDVCMLNTVKCKCGQEFCLNCGLEDH